MRWATLIGGLLLFVSVAPQQAEAAPRYYESAVINLPRVDARKASRYRATVRQRVRLGRIGANRGR